MKRNIKAIILIVIIVLTTTGCGNSKYIVNKDNVAVKYDINGQLLQKNILCLPKEDGELYNLYKEYKDQLDNKFEKIPSCEEFKFNSTPSKGIWDFLFVKPLAWLILKLGDLVNNLGLSLIIIGLLIRILLLPLTIRSSKQAINLKKAQPEIERIERKYQGITDKDVLFSKSQEQMLIYQKYKVNPMGGCLISFIQLPLFFAFLQAVYRVPAIYEEKLFGFNLGMSPLKGFETGQWTYLFLMILIVGSTYFSFKQSLNQTSGTGVDGGKQMRIMLYVMLIVISWASLTLPTTLAFYWIITNIFIIIQNKITEFNLNSKKRKHKNQIIKKELKIKNNNKKKDGKIVKATILEEKNNNSVTKPSSKKNQKSSRKGSRNKKNNNSVTKPSIKKNQKSSRKGSKNKKNNKKKDGK